MLNKIKISLSLHPITLKALNEVYYNYLNSLFLKNGAKLSKILPTVIDDKRIIDAPRNDYVNYNIVVVEEIQNKKNTNFINIFGKTIAEIVSAPIKMREPDLKITVKVVNWDLIFDSNKKDVLYLVLDVNGPFVQNIKTRAKRFFESRNIFLNKITAGQNNTPQIVIPYKFTKHSLIKTDNQSFIKEFKIQSKHEFDKLLGTVIYIKNEHIEVKH